LCLGLWLAIPTLHPPAFVVQGPATAQQACMSRWCAEVGALAGRPLACRADLFGLRDDGRLRGPGPRGLPSVALAGPTEAVLPELRQSAELLFRRSQRAHAMAARCTAAGCSTRSNGRSPACCCGVGRARAWRSGCGRA
jgi:hypothetical protein